jgi:hypothetical protein
VGHFPDFPVIHRLDLEEAVLVLPEVLVRQQG